MNPIEGQISIDIYTREAAQKRVEIASSRPLLASRVLRGKQPGQVLSMIPLMYNICGTAHSRAALMSLQQCLQHEPDPGMEAARDMLLLAEIAREHLLRVFLDWPRLFDIDAGNHKLAFLNGLPGDLQAALFTEGQAFSLDSRLAVQSNRIEELIGRLQQFLHRHVFLADPEDWLANNSLDSIPRWSEHSDTIAAQAIQRIYSNGWESQGKTPCLSLPELGFRQLLERFDADNADEFIATPDWQGCCYETTAMSRQLEYPLIQSLYVGYGNSLITRWLARLVELARIPRQLAVMLAQINGQSYEPAKVKPAEGGVAQVETARGRLIHRVETGQGVISNYQVLAPTEWNFHPRGLVSQTLASLKTDDNNELSRLAHLAINAIDPCVGYTLRVH